MTGLMLNFAYAAGLGVTSPLWLYRLVRHGRYRSGWRQRLGNAPIRYGLQPAIWIHGVSLGEINAAKTLVNELHSQLPDYRVVVSSTTDTGMAAATRLFAADHKVFHWPLDFTFAVKRALDHVRPELVILMEGELWPNFLETCRRRGIHVAVVNARLSPTKGYPRYRRVAPLVRRLLFSKLSAVGVQDETYAQRFAELGVPSERLHVTGMLKYDSAHIGDDVPHKDALASAMGIRQDCQLLVAGGTGEGEESIVLNAWADAARRHPSLRLCIVPRKPERFEEVARLIKSAGHELVRRSDHPDGAAPASSQSAVLLGDTMGELRKFYALASSIFVGRSLVNEGGSDMIEAAAMGKPTCFGPHTFNFPQADELAANGCRRLVDGADLAKCICEWLNDPAAAQAEGQKARRFIENKQGATRRNVEMICRLLGRTPAAAPGAIATEAIKQQVV
jgi:3-deoxy-D-manno-octulosonic-acid transferase